MHDIFPVYVELQPSIISSGNTISSSGGSIVFSTVSYNLSVKHLYAQSVLVRSAVHYSRPTTSGSHVRQNRTDATANARGNLQAVEDGFLRRWSSVAQATADENRRELIAIGGGAKLGSLQSIPFRYYAGNTLFETAYVSLWTRARQLERGKEEERRGTSDETARETR